jgi:predicted TPR repeat methyltransferase
MKKQKQKFIKTHISNPVKLLKQSFSFLPKALPFLSKQKKNLDEWSEAAREKLKNPAKSNFQLGKKFFIEKKYSDAKFRFKLAILFNNEYSLAYFFLARVYLAKGLVQKALDSLAKAQKYKINNQEFAYFYKIYIQNDFTILPHLEQSKEFFNNLASLMDSFYIEHFSYRGVEQVFNLFETHKQESHNKILDLGCGKGLLAQKIKSSFQNSKITGLDFAPEMINISKNLILATESSDNETNIINVKEPDKKTKPNSIYDFLIRSDFNKFTDFSKIYDIIISRGFLNYQSNHSEVITKISQLIIKEGYFIGYINQPLSQEVCLDKRDNFSVPFFHNYQKVEFAKLNNIFIKNSFDLITKQEFALEKDSLATIFIYQKK